MSSRYTSPFDDLLDRNRRELDALYESTGRAASSRPGRPGRASAAPAASGPTPDPGAGAAGRASREPDRPAPAEGSATVPPPAASPAERRLDERYGDGWRFDVTSRRRERDEVIVVGTLRLPGSGGVRTQFGSARIAAGGGATSGSAGGVAFSFGGASGERPLAAEEAAFERAREDALANCAALAQDSGTHAGDPGKRAGPG